jgi:hypothetical protein
LGAVEERRRHLYALMRFYPEELLLITRSVMDQSFVKPPAPFNR